MYNVYIIYIYTYIYPIYLYRHIRLYIVAHHRLGWRCLLLRLLLPDQRLQLAPGVRAVGVARDVVVHVRAALFTRRGLVAEVLARQLVHLPDRREHTL